MFFSVRLKGLTSDRGDLINASNVELCRNYFPHSGIFSGKSQNNIALILIEFIPTVDLHGKLRLNNSENS